MCCRRVSGVSRSRESSVRDGDRVEIYRPLEWIRARTRRRLKAGVEFLILANLADQVVLKNTDTQRLNVASLRPI